MVVISLPFCILYRIRLSVRQRVVLSSLFSLALITIVVSIVRVLVGTPKVANKLDGGMILLFSHIETNVGKRHELSFSSIVSWLTYMVNSNHNRMC